MPAFFRDVFEQNFKSFKNTFLRNMLWLYHRLYVCTVSVFSYQMLIDCNRHIHRLNDHQRPILHRPDIVGLDASCVLFRFGGTRI